VEESKEYMNGKIEIGVGVGGGIRVLMICE